MAENLRYRARRSRYLDIRTIPTFTSPMGYEHNASTAIIRGALSNCDEEIVEELMEVGNNCFWIYEKDDISITYKLVGFNSQKMPIFSRYNGGEQLVLPIEEVDNIEIHHALDKEQIEKWAPRFGLPQLTDLENR